MSRPLCRYCGGPIPKKTDTVYFRHVSLERNRGLHARDIYCETPPLTKTEAQRLVNQEIVSVRRSDRWDRSSRPEGRVVCDQTDTIDHINTATTWDGSSYVDAFFCKGPCATRFAYLFAREGKCTVDYNAARALQREKEDSNVV